jgi:hypothetical protein
MRVTPGSHGSYSARLQAKSRIPDWTQNQWVDPHWTEAN